MNTINIAADATAQRIGIGNQYENLATAVVFDCSKFAEDHGAGTAQVVHRRPTESIGYVCTNVSQEGNTVTWLVTDDDTSFTGKGQVQLRWYVNDVLRESVIFPTYILPSVASSDDAPVDVKSALEQLMEWVNDNTISIEDLDERIANYFDEHPIPTPVTSVNEKLGDVVLTAEDVGAYSAEEADEKFCVPDGGYEELNTGTAKQLLSDSYTLDQVPYLFRKSPDSDRAVEEIVGGTVGWNQLIPNMYKSYTNSETDSKDSFNLKARQSVSPYTDMFNKYIPSAGLYNYIVNPSFTGDAVVIHNGSQRNFFIASSISIIEGHKYLFSIKVNSADVTTIGGLSIDNLQLIDLTTMFGTTIADYIYSLETATAGAGVAWVRQYIDLDTYHEYCEPILRSVDGLVSKKTVGFNQFDISVANFVQGNFEGGALPNNVHTEGYTPVIPGETYCFHTRTVFSGRYIRFYDDNKVEIESAYITNYSTADFTFTVPSNATSMRFMLYRNTGYPVSETQNEQITINLSDPTKNGTYEPYESHTYSLDSSVVLRGVPKLDSNNNLYYDGDVYPSDGNGSRRFTERAYQSGDESLADAITDGTTTVVKLSTPTTFTAQPYHNPQIVGDTEEFVTTGIVPVGHATKYYQNLRKKIEGLPWNFATLIAPTEVTNKATRNYTTGSYLILNNVLYKVTANIANGGTITPNTNCTATTIMAEIMSL